MKWRWWRRAEDTSDEAKAHLARLEANDAKVARLGEELRQIQRKNHFSGMVDAAISRRARTEGV